MGSCLIALLVCPLSCNLASSQVYYIRFIVKYCRYLPYIAHTTLIFPLIASDRLYTTQVTSCFAVILCKNHFNNLVKFHYYIK